MISPSTRDASTADVEVVVAWGASASSVEAGTTSGDDMMEVVVHLCDRTASKWGVCFLKINRGILDEARMRKHTYEAYKDKFKVENIITSLFKVYKIRKQNVLQKIEHVCESVSLDNQGHSPHLRGEDLLR
jgi:hypothetical protein